LSRAVLIVDDDQFIRKLIATTLEDVADFDLHEAADGEQALEVADREQPTLVFLDVDMPELNGIEACREEAGADLFLTKPFSPLDLLRLVDELGEQGP